MDKRISRQYFNDHAKTWDETARNNDPEKLLALVNKLDLPDDSWILDVGAGTGVFLPYIKESVNGQSRLFSMDFAINMISIAKRKQAEMGIHFICAEIENLRFCDELFDAVICYSTFPHFHNKPLSLRNIYGMLKPGGRLYICHTASREFINQIHSSVPDLIDHLLPDDAEMMKLLSESGFTDYKIESKETFYLVTARKYKLTCL